MPSVLLSPAPITAVISGHPVCSLTPELETRLLRTRLEQKECPTFWKTETPFLHTMGRAWQSLLKIMCCIILSLRISVLIVEDGRMVDICGKGEGFGGAGGCVVMVLHIHPVS